MTSWPFGILALGLMTHTTRFLVCSYILNSSITTLYTFIVRAHSTGKSGMSSKNLTLLSCKRNYCCHHERICSHTSKGNPNPMYVTASLQKSTRHVLYNHIDYKSKNEKSIRK